MLSAYYRSSISDFIKQSNDSISGQISNADQFETNRDQRNAWKIQINILKKSLSSYEGYVFFEFSIPRLGKRVDAIVIIQNVVFVIEFKVGEEHYHNYAIEQVWDYALDLKNFHEPS